MTWSPSTGRLEMSISGNVVEIGYSLGQGQQNDLARKAGLHVSKDPYCKPLILGTHLASHARVILHYESVTAAMYNDRVYVNKTKQKTKSKTQPLSW